MNPTATPTAEMLQATLQERLQPAFVHVTDESAAHAGHGGSNGQGYGTHFRVRIGSPAFDGLARIAVHRLVYDALQPYFNAGLHALAIEIQR